MCRKLLIEPLRPGQDVMAIFAADRRIYESILQSEDRHILENLSVGAGDS